MPTSTSPLRADIPVGLPATLFAPWTQGSMAYNRWLMGTLDAQTALWREMERQMAGLMQFWVGPAAPPPSAQGLVDAAQGLAAPAAWPRLWSGWFQVCADAMRHDASEA